MRPRPGADPIVHVTLMTLRDLARRIRQLDAETKRISGQLKTLVSEVAPSLLDVHGLGPDGAAVLLVAAGDNPGRIHSETAWAHLCGVAPIPASSGKTIRHRLNRGGNRQANSVLYQIVICRMSTDPPTRTYVTPPPSRRPHHRRDRPDPQTLRRQRDLQAPPPKHHLNP